MSDVIFILDWDDTLFPTTYIKDLSKNTINNNISVDYIISLYNFLNHCLELGKVYILTLSKNNWVKYCAKSISDKNINFLELINRTKIIEANIYSNINSNKNSWKSLAVNDILSDQTKRPKKIISCGDMVFDFLSVISNLQKKIKSVFFKFSQNPTIDFITNELKKCKNVLPKVISKRVKNLLITMS